MKLSDYPFFLKGLDKIKGDDDIVKCLHMLMFSSVGKKLEAKKNIRLFSGFADEKKKDERKMKVLENKKKWTIQMLKDTMSLFGLEKTGNRNELVEKFMDYLMSPSVIKDDASAGGLKKKTAASSKTTKTKGTKRKAKDSGAEPKKKRAPTSYILFAASQRAEIKTDNPDATFAEVGVLLGEKWKALDEDEKKVHILPSP